MEDTLAIIFALIISIIIMFLFPLIDTWDLQDNLSYATAYATVVDFVDTVRNTGKITPEVYYAFETKLGLTGNTYAISMEHRKCVLVPDGNKKDAYGNPILKQEYLNVYTNEIINDLKNGHDTGGGTKLTYYPMDKYDYFYVTIKNTNVTQATVLKQFLLGKQETFKIGTAYGGVVWSMAD